MDSKRYHSLYYMYTALNQIYKRLMEMRLTKINREIGKFQKTLKRLYTDFISIIIVVDFIDCDAIELMWKI